MKRPRIQRLSVDESTQAQRIIRLLSQIYEIGYDVVRVYYYRYNEKVQVVKLHLNRIYKIGNELEIIN